MEGILHLKTLQTAPRILVFSGTDHWDAELSLYGNFEGSLVRHFFDYFKEGGLENFCYAGECLQLLLEKNLINFPPLVKMPKFGWYQKSDSVRTLSVNPALSLPVPSFREEASPGKAQGDQGLNEDRPVAWVCFYRAWYQTGDMAVIDCLWDALAEAGFRVRSFYAYSLRDHDAQQSLLDASQSGAPHVILTLQSFSICINDGNRISFLESLGCPVLQVPVSSQNRDAWLQNPRGFSPF